MKQFKTYILFFLSLSLYAQSVKVVESSMPDLNSATVLETSLSKRTISLNIGSYEGFKNNERATLMTRSKKHDSEKMIFLGEGELVKVFPHNSIWKLTKN